MDDRGAFGSTEMGRKYRGKYGTPHMKSKQQIVQGAIKEILADGVMLRKSELLAAIAEKGIEKAAAHIDEAKRRLNLKIERIPGSKNEWTWRLPTDDEREIPAQVGKEESIDLARTHHLCEDELSITMAERKRLGIRDNEQVFHVRDPKWWTKHEPQDPARAFLRHNEGSRIIMENGEPVPTGMDTILAVRPMEEVEKLRAREQQQIRDLENEGRRPRRSDDFDRDHPHGLDPERAKHANSEAHMNAGMIGPQSPSSGVALEDYIHLKQLSKAQIEAEERLYSLGPHYSKVYSDEEAEAMEAANRRAGGRGRGENERGGGKFFSLPPNIRPRNLAQR